MLGRMTPEQLDEWAEYYKLEPWGDDWLQTGTIAATVHNVVAGIAAAMGKSQSEPKFLEPGDFVPQVETKTNDSPNIGSAAQQTAAVRALVGF